MAGITPLIIDRADGETVWYDGGLVTYKATGAQTGGAFSLIEVLMPRGKATPLHVHPESDETFYVLDGEILTHIGDIEHAAATGAVTMVPRGTPHAFLVKSATCRLLVVFTPASEISEAFFREAGVPAATRTLPSFDTDPARFMTAAERTGLQVLGPPPFAAAAMPVG